MTSRTRIIPYEGFVHETEPASKQVLLKFLIFTRKNLCQSLFSISCRPKGLQRYQKETPTLFFCEFSEIFKNSFFYWPPLVVASDEVFSDFKHFKITPFMFVRPHYFFSLISAFALYLTPLTFILFIFWLSFYVSQTLLAN